MNRSEIKERTLVTISSLRGIHPADIHEDHILESDLGMDSLDLIETVMAMESELSIGVPDDEVIRKEMSVREFINHLESIVNE